MSEKSTEQTRVVEVYSTQGNSMKEVNSSASTWKQLQKELNEYGVSYSGMKAVVGETRVTLESENAVLPEGKFTLFLMPVKTKSGAGLDRATLFANIKALVAKKPEMKQKFIIDGKNMTQLSTDKLNELWAKYGESGDTSSPQPATSARTEKPKAKEEAVQSVVSSLGNHKALEDAVEKAKKAYQNAVAADVDEATQDILLEKLTNAKLALKNAQAGESEAPKTEKPAVPVETEQQKQLRLAEEAKQQRLRELQKQGESLRSEFKDVK